MTVQAELGKLQLFVIGLVIRSKVIFKLRKQLLLSILNVALNKKINQQHC